MSDHELSETHYVRGYRDALTFVETALALEQGRQLASERDDLIAAGVDPAALRVPLAPSNPALDRVRVVALAWIHQEPDGCEDTVQQIKDGHTMLRVLDGGA